MNNRYNFKIGGGGSVGLLGALVLLGVIGLGPCADDCSGCGPTLKDAVQNVHCPVPGDSK